MTKQIWRINLSGDAAGCHQTKAVMPNRAREPGGYLQASYGVSERRASDVFPSSRATILYKSRRPDQASLKIRAKELPITRVRYGYRRIHVMLQRGA
jgi:putative transposase